MTPNPNPNPNQVYVTRQAVYEIDDSPTLVLLVRHPQPPQEDAHMMVKRISTQGPIRFDPNKSSTESAHEHAIVQTANKSVGRRQDRKGKALALQLGIRHDQPDGEPSGRALTPSPTLDPDIIMQQRYNSMRVAPPVLVSGSKRLGGECRDLALCVARDGTTLSIGTNFKASPWYAGAGSDTLSVVPESLPPSDVASDAGSLASSATGASSSTGASLAPVVARESAMTLSERVTRQRLWVEAEAARAKYGLDDGRREVHRGATGTGFGPVWEGNKAPHNDHGWPTSENAERHKSVDAGTLHVYDEIRHESMSINLSRLACHSLGTVEKMKQVLQHHTAVLAKYSVNNDLAQLLASALGYPAFALCYVTRLRDMVTMGESHTTIRDFTSGLLAATEGGLPPPIAHVLQTTDRDMEQVIWHAEQCQKVRGAISGIRADAAGTEHPDKKLTTLCSKIGAVISEDGEFKLARGKRNAEWKKLFKYAAQHAETLPQAKSLLDAADGLFVDGELKCPLDVRPPLSLFEDQALHATLVDAYPHEVTERDFQPLNLPQLERLPMLDSGAMHFCPPSPQLSAAQRLRARQINETCCRAWDGRVVGEPMETDGEPSVPEAGTMEGAAVDLRLACWEDTPGGSSPEQLSKLQETAESLVSIDAATMSFILDQSQLGNQLDLPAHDIAARGAFMDACKAQPELWKLATNDGALLPSRSRRRVTFVPVAGEDGAPMAAQPLAMTWLGWEVEKTTYLKMKAANQALPDELLFLERWCHGSNKEIVKWANAADFACTRARNTRKRATDPMAYEQLLDRCICAARDNARGKTSDGMAVAEHEFVVVTNRSRVTKGTVVELPLPDDCDPRLALLCQQDQERQESRRRTHARAHRRRAALVGAGDPRGQVGHAQAG